tara:strand:- start:75 stop:422 length:348 start_codon:yes stop_codon:yes gene_type:complete
MTSFVKEGSETIVDGMTKMMAAMKEDFNAFMPTNLKMCEEYAESLEYKVGNKYIKLVSKNNGVKAFIVNVEDDKKFKFGDILMPAGYSAPARNGARGNILEGSYAINWTGACYLK